MNIYEKIEDLRISFEAKENAIRQNEDLSQAGRDKALKTLTAEKQAAFKSVLPSLRKMAVVAAIRADELRGMSWALGQIEADNYDYSRLTYEAQAVKSALALAGDDLQKVEELWNQAKATNDNYKIKAFLDVVPASIPEGTLNTSLWNELKAELANGTVFLNSPKRAEFEAERNGYLDELTLISESAAVVADALGRADGRNNFANMNVMPRVFEGIAIENGELKVEFGRQADKNGSLEDENKTYERLEALYAERIKGEAEVFKAFGYADYDPIMDGG